MLNRAWATCAHSPALLLDYNGTLADDEALQGQIWMGAFRAQGIDYSTETYFKRHVGLADPDVVTAAMRQAGRPLDAETLRALVTDRRRRYVDAAQTARPVSQQSVALLQRLDDEKVPWCIVSAAARVEIEAGLSASGVDPRDVGIVAVDDVQRPKPDPQAHRLGLARLGRSTEDAWAVEDSRAGITAARGAGLRVAGVGKSLAPSVLADLADLVGPVDATLLDIIRDAG